MNRFTYLLAAVAALALAAWFASHKEQQKFAGTQQDVFLPELAEALAELDEVRIHAAGAEPVTLQLADAGWQVAERDGYPASTEVLRRELRKLAEARTLEQKTSQAQFYERLGVQDVDLAKDTTVRLSASADGQPVVDLLIGKPGKGGSYVRRTGAAESWLLDTRISLPQAAPAWLDKDLVDIGREDIARITVEPVEGPDYALARGEDEGSTLSLTPPAPEGREPNVANLNRLGAALSRLRLQDIATTLPEDLDWAELRYETRAGLVLEVRAGRQDSQRYLQLAASATDAAGEEVAAEVQRINALAAGRSFAMSQYAVDAMRMSYEMLLKDPPEEGADG